MAKIRITFCEESLDVIRKACAIKGVCVWSFTAEQSVSGQCQRGRISHMASKVLQSVAFLSPFHFTKRKSNVGYFCPLSEMHLQLFPTKSCSYTNT